ncbi:MAG: SDR family NAD(P)-dependent oxidoreductase [Verrucomicrobiales bacterium]
MSSTSTSNGFRKAVIIGATSAIAREIARALAGDRRHSGITFHLLGRDRERLEAVAADLRLASGVEVTLATVDFAAGTTEWDQALRLPDGSAPDLVLIAAAAMPAQDAMEKDAALLAGMIELNISTTASQCLAAARLMRDNGGTLGVIGSVAGDRGKGSNFLYGAGKRALETMLEGLEHKLGPSSTVRVCLLKPGFVESPMTAGMPPSPLFTSAPAAGKLCARALTKGKRVAYIPGWWKCILLVIRLLPRPIFLRVKF